MSLILVALYEQSFDIFLHRFILRGRVTFLPLESVNSLDEYNVRDGDVPVLSCGPQNSHASALFLTSDG